MSDFQRVTAIDQEDGLLNCFIIDPYEIALRYFCRTQHAVSLLGGVCLASWARLISVVSRRDLRGG